jgi:hypothetical protein
MTKREQEVEVMRWTLATVALDEMDPNQLVQGVTPDWKKVLQEVDLFKQGQDEGPLDAEDITFLKQVAFPEQVKQMRLEHDTLLQLVAEVITDPSQPVCPCGAGAFSLKPQFNSESAIWELRCLKCKVVAAWVDSDLTLHGNKSGPLFGAKQPKREGA